MYRVNLPVPAAPRAPFSLRWLWWNLPPAVITWLYRTVLPPVVRGCWNPARTPNSHLALAAILGEGPLNGWAAFERLAFPRVKDGIPFWLDG
jgi:hypothetical protein